MNDAELKYVKPIDLENLNEMLAKINDENDHFLYYISDTDYHDYAPDTIIYEVNAVEPIGVIVKPDGTLMFMLEEDYLKEDTVLYKTKEAANADLRAKADVKAVFETADGYAIGFNKTEKQVSYEEEWLKNGHVYDDPDDPFDESNLE